MARQSSTYQYIHDLPTEERHDDHLIKIANARDLISQMPSPSNVRRDQTLIPDAPISFVLSTTSALPEHILKRIAGSKNKNDFNNTNLLGLCNNGRGMPVDIFLHDYLMAESDDSGALFEEVTWHETVHGIEGIELNKNGQYVRNTPWSYKLQQDMLAIDAEHGHVPAPLDDNFLRAYVEYLREGTDLQEHVSEVFARVAVTFMYEIKETGMALTSAKEFFKLISKDTSERTRKNSNISDFLIASETFSEDANLLFAEQTDALIKNVAKLYGCVIS